MSVNRNIEAKVGNLEPLKIYPVTEDELIILERGYRDSIYFTLSITLLSIFITTLIGVLYIDKIESSKLIFINSIMISCFLTGTIFLIIWSKQRKNNHETLVKIRARIEAEKTRK